MEANQLSGETISALMSSLVRRPINARSRHSMSVKWPRLLGGGGRYVYAFSRVGMVCAEQEGKSFASAKALDRFAPGPGELRHELRAVSPGADRDRSLP